MQIHELNTFDGELSSGVYVAVDDGTDTAKTPVTNITAGVEADLAQAQADLNRRINNIISPSGTAPNPDEIIDARYGADGVQYTNLGTAIRTQITDLKSDLTNVTGNTPITLTKNTCTDINDPLTQVSYSGFSSAVIPCTSGDIFSIKGFGGNGSRLWMFVNSSGTVIASSSANASLSEFVTITAPSNSAYLSVNNNNSMGNMFLYKGELLMDDVDYARWSDATPITTFNKTMFEKGSIASGRKDEYREDFRIRSTSLLYSLNAIEICKKSLYSSAEFAVIFYNNAKNVIQDTGWQSAYKIPQGSIFTVILTNSNTATSGTPSLDEIYGLFEFTPIEVNIIENTENVANAKVGYFNFDNGFFEPFSSERVAVFDFIKCDKRLMKFQMSNDYKCYLAGYDKDFNLLGEVPTGWIRGLRYVDLSNYGYVRPVIGNGTDTSLTIEDALNNISIEKSVPLIHDHLGRTVESLSKDGINQERKTYAPLYPQSSIVSFQKAYDQGFRSLMMHVQFTADDKMVVLHDVTINYSAVNTDGTDISESLRVDGLTLEQLDQYDFGLKFGAQYRGTKITRFADALMFAKKHNMGIFIEPTLALSNEKAEQVCALLKEYGYIRNACYYSSRYVELEYVHSLLPHIDLCLETGSASAIVDWASRFASLKTDNRLFSYETPTTFTDEAIEALANNGIEAMAQDYTGDEPNNLITLIDEHPYLTRIISQIIPANIAVTEE